MRGPWRAGKVDRFARFTARPQAGAAHPSRAPAPARSQTPKDLALRSNNAALPPRMLPVHDYCWQGRFRSWSATTVRSRSFVCGHTMPTAITRMGADEPLPGAEPLRCSITTLSARHRGTTPPAQVLLRPDEVPLPQLHAVAAQVVMVLLTYTLRQWQLWNSEEHLAQLTPRGWPTNCAVCSNGS